MTATSKIVANTKSKASIGQDFIYIAGLSALLAFCLGIYGYHHYLPPAHSWFDNIYYSVSLFLFEFNAQERPVPITLEIARWLAPSSLGYAAFKTIGLLLRDYIDNFKANHLKNHAIIYGLNNNSLATIESFIQSKIRTIVITDEHAHHLIDSAKSMGAYVITPKNNKTYKFNQNIHKARYFLATSEDDNKNIEIIFDIFKVKKTKTTHFLYSAVEIKDPSLASAICNHPIFSEDYDFFSARIIDYKRISTRILINQHGPDKEIPGILKTSDNIKILIIGDNDTVENIIFRLASIGHYGNTSPISINLISPNAKKLMVDLTKNNDALSEILNLQAQDLDVSILNREISERMIDSFSPNLIYLCPEDIKTSVIWSQLLNSLKQTIPTIFIYEKNLAGNIIKGLMASKSHFKFYNLFSSKTGYQYIFNQKQDKIAKLIHKNYVSQQIKKGDSLEKNSSLVDWQKLPENLKDANRNQADHTEIKCRLLMKDKKHTKEGIKKELNEDNIKLLAKIEHERWYAEKRLDGWKHTTGEKDTKLRLSPSLIPWDELSDDEKQKDIDAVIHILSTIDLT